MEVAVPIFEYRCLKCDHEFERLVRSSSESVECPACASPRVDKLFSAASTPRSVAPAASFQGGGGGCCGGEGCGCSTPSVTDT
jgi:putative FmdB family regulatory protein